MRKYEEYEIQAKDIFVATLTDCKEITIEVKHNVRMQGKASKHQIDVFWKYQKGEEVNTIAIECKNYRDKVGIGVIRDFHSVINDIGNISGIVVSKNGFQKGAKEYAKYYNITLKELREPTEDELYSRTKLKATTSTGYLKINKIKFIFEDERNNKSITINHESRDSQDTTESLNNFRIVDKKGVQLNTANELKIKLPQNWGSETGMVYKYKFSSDSILIINNKEELKELREIEYQYDVCYSEPEELKLFWKVAAQAILKDAMNGEILLFNKNENYNSIN